ncbi:MAG: hypothetical protein ACYC33_06800 [Thermoleophilia bacterium]
MLVAVVLALPYLVIGLVSQGPYAGRLLQGGIFALVVSAVVGAWIWPRGARADREQDERESFILGSTMRDGFAVMAVAVQAYWAWQFARLGNEGDSSFWLVVVCWGSFTVLYAYHRLRA